MPWRAEPARDVESEHFDVQHQPHEGPDAGVADTWMGSVEVRSRFRRAGQGRCGEEAVDVGFACEERRRKREDIAQALGRMVCVLRSQGLQIGDFEGVGRGFDAGDEDYAWVGGVGEEGVKGVDEEVVPEDIGAEDLAEGRFRRGFLIVGW